MAWYNTKDGQRYLIRKVAKPAGTTLVLFISLIGLISLVGLMTSSSNDIVRTVNAASVIADEAIQSTMSAILKR
jgi:archaellum component FlaG (FlaF/FlaG flagellin family)